ncbi:hypothetical protein [Sporosarcina newyorkensis]|uniref:Uncharacterized protein n=1 Tax=Sporosarcina newyorkensis TaxID=759851 RepID=A0A1T4YHQ7_9BACL|nr:hypothetical protein [Sporosarcina newyorkensis]SKB01324.1 hypothetical protein SAMN04244570_2675 [Sporosarcina newyorkensis]
MPKKDDEDNKAALAFKKADRKDKIQAIYKKAVKVNGKSLEKLSKN